MQTFLGHLPFDSAPALYTFNVPRAFATNLRAREYAKHRGVQLSWCYARDVPCLPEDRELPQKRYNAKMFSLLRFHDQQTRHLPSIYALAVGMPVRLTDTIDRSRQLYRGRKRVIHGCLGNIHTFSGSTMAHRRAANRRISAEAAITHMEGQQAYRHRGPSHGLLYAT